MISELQTKTLHDRCVRLFLRQEQRKQLLLKARERLRGDFRADAIVRTEGDAAVWACVLVGEIGQCFELAEDPLHLGRIKQLAASVELSHRDSVLTEANRARIVKWLDRWDIASSVSVQRDLDADSANLIETKTTLNVPQKNEQVPTVSHATLESVLSGFEELSLNQQGSINLTWHSLNGVPHRVRPDGLVEWLSDEQPFSTSQRRVIGRLRLPLNFEFPEFGYSLGFDFVTVPAGCQGVDRFLELAGQAVHSLPDVTWEGLNSIVGEFENRPAFLWLAGLFCRFADPICYERDGKRHFHKDVTVYKPVLDSIKVIREMRKGLPAEQLNSWNPDAVQDDSVTPINTSGGGTGKKKQARKEQVKGNEAILLSYLCTWHRYNTNEFRPGPVGLREFHQWLEEPEQQIGETSHSKSTIGRFFKSVFGGYKPYKKLCDLNTIEVQLKLKMGDISSEQLNELFVDLIEAKPQSE
ncbi:hypothetical protein Mal15_28520 [Stieleria maiorica]|uniref:Uncharacterized protein n=1 Tax=Stieleria maiorica TaxID=2795974 RepID=A0A5B9MF61_9BACT|nr:hypothetical protein [Stieleria maiorica]QEF98796.1 hypothetical protein Mal15_28520 [Stieleria maiorica]